MILTEMMRANQQGLRAECRILSIKLHQFCIFSLINFGKNCRKET